MWLRNENKSLAQTPPAASVAPPPPPDAETNAAFTTSFTARGGNGETIVAGGWASGPGRRALALVTPALSSATNGQVLVRTQLVDAPEEVWERVGLGDIRSDAAKSSQLTSLGKDQIGLLIKLLSAEQGGNLLSAPTIATPDGLRAAITLSAPGTSPDAAGPSHAIGVLPRLTSDRGSVDMTLDMKLTPAK